MTSNLKNTFPLPNGQYLNVDETNTWLNFSLDNTPLVELNKKQTSNTLTIFPQKWTFKYRNQAIQLANYWLFTRYLSYSRIIWKSQDTLESCDSLFFCDKTKTYYCDRDQFWQLPNLWLVKPTVPYPHQMQMSGEKRHPRRPSKPKGEVYRRFDNHLNTWISIRTLDINSDLALFNCWQNLPRVSKFWQESGDLERHRKYLQKLKDDPHTLTLIGCFNDEPFAYFEAYWAKEDRISPYYDVSDYDRGIHMLVGEDHHRGPHKVTSWLSGLAHYLFLDDPRTQRIVAEPRADNERMINYMIKNRFHCCREFDFPHKRAALMLMSRESFFDHCNLA
ncbi:GNAT family N-acetyltransferase [Azomonas macrocytogenes]|uniref:RimJ/RimL family protein N-acetyltransferase n=1 Tax=Azomonas macrocytogenes TaxID=69962 RepID=A0A839T5K5_AZOMA|nr:GNAT family N-acetyltransferase [Azomonas macrocytogenes]MBB3104791.1 RimJ/RimL family protein N-acetyltransferase [Azomonas macrocytogenes]